MGALAYAGSLLTSLTTQTSTLPPRPLRSQHTDLPSYCAAVKHYIDARVPYHHPYRMRRASIWRKAELYRQSVQYIRKSYNVDPTRTMHWSPIVFDERSDAAVPLPVFNEMAPPMRNESARLGKPEYKPYVRPSGEKPNAAVRAGARLGADILRQSLEDMQWDNEEELGYDHMPMYGGWWVKSYWDVTWEETTEVPVTTAVKCPDCGYMLADPALPPLAAQQLPPDRISTAVKNSGTERETTTYKAERCPQCPSPAPLLPFLPSNFAPTVVDRYNRPFLRQQPLGSWRIDTLSPFDVFSDNLGVDVKVGRWQEITYCHIKSLDYIRHRYANGHLVKPENATALLQYHPIAGERGIFYSSISSVGLFKEHARVKEYYKLPCRELKRDAKGNAVRDPITGEEVWEKNRGYYYVVAGDVLLAEGDYLIESKTRPGVFIPRCHFDYVPFEIRSGGRELDGYSMAEGLFDVQDAINQSASQQMDAQERMGAPKWLAPRDSNFEYEKGGSSGAIWWYDFIVSAPNVKPEVIGGVQFDTTKIIQAYLSYADRFSGNRQIEQGGVPPGIDAASALQLVAEQAGEGRRPRIRRIREMLQRVWSHGLLLMHEFVREPRPYFVYNDAHEWQEKSWLGLDLNGQTHVRIDPEPEHDTAIQRRQNVRDAVTLRIIDPTTSKRLALLVAKELDLPSELYEEDDLQYDSAEREYLDFLDTQKAPMLDPSLDDHSIHFNRHGIDCHSEAWRDLERQAEWDKALAFIEGWDLPGPLQPIPDPLTGKPTIDPLTNQPAMAPGPSPYEAVSLNPTLDQMAPKATEVRILITWVQLLQAAASPVLDPLMGIPVAPPLYTPPPTPEGQEALSRVLRFRAHMEAHRFKVMELAGVPPPAPSGQIGPGGATPTPGAAGTAAPNPVPPPNPPPANRSVQGSTDQATKQSRRGDNG